MRVYFRSGRAGFHERGWYRFWTVERDHCQRRYVTVRVPEDKRDVSDRLLETKSMGWPERALFGTHSRIRPASISHVAFWLSHHLSDARHVAWSKALGRATEPYLRLLGTQVVSSLEPFP